MGSLLSVTSGYPSDPFGLRILNFPKPSFRCPTSRARRLSIFMNSLSPFVRPLPVHLTEIRHDLLYEAISILLDQISAKALRYCMRSEDLGLINTFTCLDDQKPVRLHPIEFLSTYRTPPSRVLFSLLRLTKRSLPTGN